MSALDAFRAPRRRAGTRIAITPFQKLSVNCRVGKNRSGELFRLALAQPTRVLVDLIEDSRENAAYLLMEGGATLFAGNADAQASPLQFDRSVYAARSG